MQYSNYYYVYKEVVHQLIEHAEQLPSLPSITLKIRLAVSDPNTDIDTIAKLIQLDPSLSTLLFKYAASPLYLRPMPPRTIKAIVAMIGRPALSDLVMRHSIKSLFVFKKPKLKKLYALSWERMIYKGATSQFLAKKLGFHPAEEALTASILTEVGTLAVLSAFSNDIKVPETKVYFQLCRLYSKSLSSILLRKWGLQDYLIEVSESCGRWGLQHANELSMVDIINLAIYSTVQHQSVNNNLPPIEQLNSYKHLPASLNTLTADKRLFIVQDNLDLIDTIVESIR